MKKLLLTFLITCTATITFGLDSYVRLSSGYALLNDSDVTQTTSGGSVSADLSYDGSYLIEGAYGVNLSKDSLLSCGNMPLRAELAVGYQKHDWDKWTEAGVDYDESDNSIAFWHFMANCYWDFYNSSPATPFVVGGLGFTRAEVDHGGKDYSDTLFSGQIGAGVDFEVAENIVLDFQYRYWMAQDVEYGDGTFTDKLELSKHQFLFGAMYTF